MTTQNLERLLRQTGRRWQCAAFASRVHQAVLVVAALFALALLASRLLAVIPEFDFRWLLFVPIIAILAALAMFRRSSAPDLARLIDEKTGSKELFLTATLVDQTSGDFQPVVLSQAEARAAHIEAARVVPFHWQRGTRDILVASALLVAAVLWLPQLDPFGKEQQRQTVAQQEQRLRDLQKANAARAEQLAQAPPAAQEQVARALAELEKTFKEARPQEREANLKRLAEHQKELGEMWRKVRNELPRDAFDKAAQQFGQTDSAKNREIGEQLKKGDVSGAKKELSKLREEMKKLAAMSDSAEKRALQESLAQRLNAIAETMKQELNSPQLNAALARAMQQLDMSKLAGISSSALDAAQQSLQLSELEMQQLAEMLQNAESLEAALKNLQMAKQLADLCKLNGGECKDCNGMGDYAALYAKLLAQGGGTGPGMGPNPGQGAGGKAPEDDTLESGFKSEKTNTALTGGRMLMQWKTKEVGETGARAEDFQESIREVKQGVSEAIASERVPPGYHATIQKYFDTLPAK